MKNFNVCSTLGDDKKEPHNEYTIEKKLFRTLNVRLRITVK